MFSKSDIENFKKKLELMVGKTIIFRYNYNKVKGKKKGVIYEGVIENISSNIVVLRKNINGNIGVIESYTFVDILSGTMEIIDVY